MISKSLRGIINRGAQARIYQGMIQTQARCMGGGEKKPAMPSAERDFDVVLVGGHNATAITKFLQVDDVNYKMALISKHGKYVVPQAYLGVSHGHLKALTLETATVSGQVENWSRTDVGAEVTKFVPEENKVVLSNGREYTYKALVLAPGFKHESANIEGLPELEKTHEEENVYVHLLENKERTLRNYYHGWNHPCGDMICYMPKTPCKGEGVFYPLYYETFLREDRTVGRANANARIQVWTPNDHIYQFPYANEVALDECNKRGIDVMLGWDLTKVHQSEIGEKIATFKNVSSGEVLEKPFMHGNFNPTSLPHQNLVDAGITNSDGLIDVNPYTLQHERFENIFAFGDAIAGNTTRTQSAAQAQCPIVKHNLKQFMEGKEVNAVYDGYSYFELYMSHSHATNFSHLWDYVPAPKNHWISGYGLFGRAYFKYQMSTNLSAGVGYTSFKKNHGPPHQHFNPQYDPLDHNEYLQAKGVDVEALKNHHKKGGVVPT